MTKQEYMAMSLPYDLQVFNEKGVRKTYAAVHYSYEFEPDFEKFTPILRPLTYLPRLIIQKGYNNEAPFFPLYRLQREDKAFTTDFIHAFGVEECKFSVIELLLKWHFDLFGGVESGEAIDVNSLDINPYE